MVLDKASYYSTHFLIVLINNNVLNTDAHPIVVLFFLFIIFFNGERLRSCIHPYTNRKQTSISPYLLCIG